MRHIFLIGASILFGLLLTLGIQKRAEAPSSWPASESVLLQAVPEDWVSTPDSVKQNGSALLSGDATISVELAVSEEERTLGLGNREAIAPQAGMLFVFPRSDFHGIWMKGMRFPLDIIWLASPGLSGGEPRGLVPAPTGTECAQNYEKGKKCLIVVDIKENVVPESYPESFFPQKRASYVLEMNGGAARKNGITIGSVLMFK